MKEKEQAFVLTIVVFCAIAMILLVVRIGGGSSMYIAGYTSAAMFLVAGIFSTAVISQQVLQKRPWKSGIANYKYHRARRKAYNALKEYPCDPTTAVAIFQTFRRDANAAGVFGDWLSDEFQELKERAWRKELK